MMEATANRRMAEAPQNCGASSFKEYLHDLYQLVLFFLFLPALSVFCEGCQHQACCHGGHHARGACRH